MCYRLICDCYRLSVLYLLYTYLKNELRISIYWLISLFIAFLFVLNAKFNNKIELYINGIVNNMFGVFVLQECNNDYFALPIVSISTLGLTAIWVMKLLYYYDFVIKCGRKWGNI